MRLKQNANRGLRIAASCLFVYGFAASPSFGDDPQSGGSRLARLFRLGGGSSSSAAPSPGSTPTANSPATTPIIPPGMLVTTPTTPVQPPSTPDLSAGSSAHRITPHSRASKPPTEADPVLTRVSLGRADNGTQFGMFLQVFADGTVLDGEGVHHVSADLMKPLLETLHQGDIYRVKGHCGTPATDEIEAAHVVVYERAYGKLRASSFSYSGNPHGCDASVHKMHKALEAIQMKLSHVVPGTIAAPAASNRPTATPTALVANAHSDAAPPLTLPAAHLAPMPHAPVVNPAPAAVLSLTPPNP